MKGGLITVKQASIFYDCCSKTARLKLRTIAEANGLFKTFKGHKVPDIKSITYVMFCEALNIEPEYLDKVLSPKKPNL